MQLSIDGIIHSDSVKTTQKTGKKNRSTSREEYSDPIPTGKLHDDLFSADLRATGMVFFENITVGQLSSRLNRRLTMQDNDAAIKRVPRQTIPVTQSSENERAQVGLFDDSGEVDDLSYLRYNTKNDDEFDESMYDLPFPEKEGFELAVAQFMKGLRIARDGVVEITRDITVSGGDIAQSIRAHARSIIELTPEALESVRHNIAARSMRLKSKLGLSRLGASLLVHRLVIAALIAALVIALK